MDEEGSMTSICGIVSTPSVSWVENAGLLYCYWHVGVPDNANSILRITLENKIPYVLCNLIAKLPWIKVEAFIPEDIL